MRRKIKELMKKEEGFTLVELLAVIVILGIIVAIAIPGIGKVIENAQTDANTQEVALVEDAARLYFTTSENSNINEVTVEKLITDGYLENTNNLNPDAKIIKDDKGVVSVESPESLRAGTEG